MVDNALKELEVKRELENKEAELHKEKRDKLNNEAKKWLNERNVFNNKLKDLISEANKLRVLRDEYNEKVKNEKNERSKWYRASLQFEEDLVNMKKEKQPKNGTPLWKLKKELKELEFKQMTSVLTKQKEDELVQSISRLQSQIKEANESLYRDPEINELAKKLEEAKEKSENAHQQVNENANLAQEYHEQMMKIYESVDELRKKIDEAQEEFIKIKIQADEEHKKHIECINNIHDIDKMVRVLKNKEKEDKVASYDDVLQKLLSGEKVNTEDLLTAQKTGKN